MFLHLQINQQSSHFLFNSLCKPSCFWWNFLPCVCVWAHALLTPESYYNRRLMFPEEITIFALNVSQSDLGPWSQANLRLYPHTRTHILSRCYTAVMGKPLNVFQLNPKLNRGSQSHTHIIFSALHVWQLFIRSREYVWVFSPEGVTLLVWDLIWRRMMTMMLMAMIPSMTLKMMILMMMWIQI